MYILHTMENKVRIYIYCIDIQSDDAVDFNLCKNSLRFHVQMYGILTLISQ